MRDMKQSSREIWSWNKEKEMKSLRHCLRSFRFIAIDTEFPGCLKETPMEAAEEIRYRDMRFNIHKTKLIQFGFTLFDGEGRIGGTWEVNFSDFIESKDAKNSKSMEFLRRNGLNLEKIREQGIGIDEFFKEFTQILNESKSEKKMTWITFHGSYDKAYLVKGFTGGQILPETSQDFAQVVERLLGDVVDVKEIAGLGLFPCLSSHYGLQRVADAFQIRRVGKAHHAGSDSELTARVFIKMAPILSQDYKRKMRLRADQEELMMMTTCYVPQPLRPRPMMFAAFGGFFVVPVQRFNYV
ncbi:putative CCR4-associated factor 1 [Cardamine amara subsp. amara]|uniref:poly(A)-specific ribonuclease n=1 Tax=Cardamine amara subsp. amara TaxID=228776 RepID=A0ABD1BJM5_CARAN